MKRRQFLGFLGGAAAAGPAAAKNVLSSGSLSQLGGGAVPVPPMGGFAVPISSGDQWKVSRIAQLKKFIAGDALEEQRAAVRRKLYMADTYERARLDSLRSVSAVNKHRMLSAGEVERQMRIRREESRFELADLLGT